MQQDEKDSAINQVTLIILQSLSKRDKKKFINHQAIYSRECRKQGLITEEDYLIEIENLNSLILKAERTI